MLSLFAFSHTFLNQHVINKLFAWIVGLGGVDLAYIILNGPKGFDERTDVGVAYEDFGRSIITILVIIGTITAVRAIKRSGKKKKGSVIAPFVFYNVETNSP